MHRLTCAAEREHIVFKLREKELNNGLNLFDALMNAARIDKDAILIPKFVDCRATAVRVSRLACGARAIEELRRSDKDVNRIITRLMDALLALKTSNKFRSMIFSTDCSISFSSVLT